LNKYAQAACQISFALCDREIKAAVRCNARELDYESLTVKDGWVTLRMVDPITSVRLLLG